MPAPQQRGRPRVQTIFAHDFFYISHELGPILWILVLLVGGILVFGDVYTTQAGGYVVEAGISSPANLHVQSFVNIIRIIAVVFALVPLCIWFVLVLRVGRHYSVREAQQTVSNMGLDGTSMPEGGLFMLWLVAHLLHILPILLALIGIGTTAAGLVAFWQSAGGVTAMQTVYAWIVGGVCGLVVYACGPTFIVTSFHFLAQGKREGRMAMAIHQDGALKRLPAGARPIMRGLPAPSGATKIEPLRDLPMKKDVTKQETVSLASEGHRWTE